MDAVFSRQGGRARRAAVGLVAVAGSCLAASPARAGISGFSGAVEFMPAPADARIDSLVRSDVACVWNEAQNVRLKAPLNVDAVNPGLYNDAADLEFTQIPAGTLVSSHYIHFDSPGESFARALGSVRFDAPILGVIVTGDLIDQDIPDLTTNLDDSDFLGVGTIYPDGQRRRGLEYHTDLFTISLSRRTITFDLSITVPGDYIRVITAAVPSPGSGVLAGVGVIAALRRRR